MAFLSRLEAFWKVSPVQLATRALSCTQITLFPVAKLKRPHFEGPLPPKRPLNSYMLFLMANKENVTESSGKLDMKTMGEMWRGLSNSEKKEYDVKADQLKIQYKSDYEAFLTSLGSKKKQNNYLVTLTKYKSDKKEYLKNFRLRRLDLVKPRKRSGYNLFLKEMLQNKAKDELMDIFASAHVKWKALSKKEMATYNKRAEELNEVALKAFRRREANAVKAGVLPPPEPKTVAVKVKKATPKTATKKGVAKGVAKKKKPALKKAVKAKNATRKATGSAAIADPLSEEVEQEEEEDDEGFVSDDTVENSVDDFAEETGEISDVDETAKAGVEDEGKDIFSDSDSEDDNVANRRT